MDFGGLPPEVNSGRMYTGPGPGTMLAAARRMGGSGNRIALRGKRLRVGGIERDSAVVGGARVDVDGFRRRTVPGMDEGDRHRLRTSGHSGCGCGDRL